MKLLVVVQDGAIVDQDSREQNHRVSLLARAAPMHYSRSPSPVIPLLYGHHDLVLVLVAASLLRSCP